MKPSLYSSPQQLRSLFSGTFLLPLAHLGLSKRLTITEIYIYPKSNMVHSKELHVYI